MDSARLTSYPRQLNRIGDRLRACIHIAQPARREPDSGLIEGLKDSQRGNPERNGQGEPPGARGIDHKQE